MKNKLLLLLILGVTFFSACSDDDDNDHALVGKWNLESVQVDESQSFVSGPLSFNWVAAEGTTLPVFGLDFPLETIQGLAEGIGGQLLAQVLKDVTFQKKGQVIATYSDAGVSLEGTVTPAWKTSEPKYLSYKIVSGSKIALYPNIVNILAEADLSLESLGTLGLSQADLNTLMAFVNKVITEGIPATYTLTDQDKKLEISLDKAFFDQVMTLLPVLSKLIPEDSNDDMIAIIKPILGALPGVWAKTTEFKIGIKLEK
ncbi:hypothetical protein [uncultured Sanguibacteroides sp.]|uniref:hypothetical protein n=1 Tax=uncultured Sanguibacteroides sp. TaxID=1635151 RepID=UPI0025FCA9AC|nr:hypothetical protein [uncultured Sanguibacteroides sp.]